MAIIKRKRGNVIYIYEKKYAGIKDGKKQWNEEVLGHIDENGNFVASKGRNLDNLPAEIKQITKTITEFRVVEKEEKPEDQLPVETVIPEVLPPKSEAKRHEEELRAKVMNDYPDLDYRPEDFEIFTKIRQGTATNKLTKIDSHKKKPDVDIATGLAKIKQKDFEVAILNNTKIQGLRQSAHQLLDALTEVFTEQGGEKSPKITLSLKDYMKKRRFNDEKAARQQVKEDLETLSSIKLSFTQKLRGGESKEYFNLALLGSHGIKNGIITVYLDTAFCTLLSGYNIMPYPRLLWKLSERINPNSFYFLRKISEHKNMNFDDRNANVISVVTLLNATPNIPSYKEVMKTNGKQLTQRIIDPFERDMDALIEVISWVYCHSNGAELTDEELRNMNYEIFIKLYVKIYWTLYPDETERLEKKAEYHKKPKKSSKTTKNTSNKAN